MRSEQPDLSVSDASLTTTAGHNALYWIVSGGLLISGVGATTMSLLLPPEESLVWPRIIATALGVLLTALSTAVIAYLLTRIVTVADVEQRYTGVLNRIARSLAHVYANLHLATSQRREGAYSHEETYQEVVLASASSVLAEFDSVTRLSGSISGAFKDSKRDLDEVLSIFVVDPVVAQTISAARLGSSVVTNEPVTLGCPQCASRVSGHLAMRAGWTSTVICQHCQATFHIHRKGDLTVYASQPRVASAAQPVPAGASSEALTTQTDMSDKITGLDGAADAPAGPSRISLTCPSCAADFSMRYKIDQVRSDGTLARVCIACACRYTVRVGDSIITSWAAGAVEPGAIIARRAAHVRVSCTVDGFPILASFPSKNGNWHAFCVSHQKVVAVSREAMRAWMKEHDPAFLADRLARENQGGTRVLSDPT